MKRFFYGLMAASLLIAGCGGEEKAAKNEFDAESVEMTAEELAQAEEEAVKELARIISEEAADIPMAEGMGADQFAADFDVNNLTEEEKMQLAAWEKEAAEWAEKEMELSEQEQEAPAVQFAINSAEIASDQKEAVAQTVEVAKAAIEQGHELAVQGHGCQLGKEEYNLSLSEQRAESLKQALVESGVDAEKIHVAGYGQALPIQWTTAEEKAEQVQELAVNRRAQLVVV